MPLFCRRLQELLNIFPEERFSSFNLEKMSERYDNAKNHASSTRNDAESELSSFTNNKTSSLN
jgi:hypothetical protein